jgi:hypothetical protein
MHAPGAGLVQMVRNAHQFQYGVRVSVLVLRIAKPGMRSTSCVGIRWGNKRGSMQSRQHNSEVVCEEHVFKLAVDPFGNKCNLFRIDCYKVCWERGAANMKGVTYP